MGNKLRNIKKIIIHCSDSDIASHQDISVIDSWHKERGFRKVGYHYFITWDGEIQRGRSLNEIGAHCIGHNAHSIGVCLGGRHRFTKIQFHWLKTLLYDLLKKYPHLTTSDIYGHYEFDRGKTCPNFNPREI